MLAKSKAVEIRDDEPIDEKAVADNEGGGAIYHPQGTMDLNRQLPQCIPVLKYINLYGGRPVKFDAIRNRFEGIPIEETVEELWQKGCLKCPGDNPAANSFWLSEEGKRRLEVAGAYQRPPLQFNPGEEPEKRKRGRPTNAELERRSNAGKVADGNAD